MKTEVTHISSHGIWILSEKELFLAYEQFPWFKDKTINEIINVEDHGRGVLYWPKLDVDLSLEIIEHPERFPLQSNCPDVNHNLILLKETPCYPLT